jgi:molecular chaperone IbpA
MISTASRWRWPGSRLTFLHRGIATRAFKQSFSLADYVKVREAQLENGLLTVDLVREVPEAMKPRRIEIATGGGPKTIEHDKAA